MAQRRTRISPLLGVLTRNDVFRLRAHLTFSSFKLIAYVATRPAQIHAQGRAVKRLTFSAFFLSFFELMARPFRFIVPSVPAVFRVARTGVRFWKSRSSRRFKLLGLVAGFVACATVRHVDETQVRTLAAQRLDCDEAFVRVLAESSPADNVARYQVEGCARQAEYDCTEHDHVVSCESTSSVARNETTPPSDTTFDPSGCNCGHLFDSHSSSPAGSPPQNVMPTSPQTNPQHR